ncbi:MAG: FAD-binding oxidoreductase [Kofleriaceae bacterium]
MPSVTYLGRTHTLREGQTILDALLDAGEDIPHACRAGACGACLVRATDGPIPAAAQAGLSESWRARGLLYACQCRPLDALSVAPLGEGERVIAHITGATPLSSTVTRVELRLRDALELRAGQYLTLRRGSVARSYSVARVVEPGSLELHVRRVEGGALSPYLCDEARPGDEVSLQGPFGDCFYVRGRPTQPLLLAGTGTGLAPLWGVVHDALDAGHAGPIHLFHAARAPDGLYLIDELRALAARHENVRYRPSVLAGPRSPELEVGPLGEVLARHVASTAGMRAYVCGDPELVAALKKQIFLGGASAFEIFADAFLPSAPAAATA